MTALYLYLAEAWRAFSHSGIICADCLGTVDSVFAQASCPFKHGGGAIRVQCLAYDVIAWWELCGQMREATKLPGFKYCFPAWEGYDQVYLGHKHVWRGLSSSI